MYCGIDACVYKGTTKKQTAESSATVTATEASLLGVPPDPPWTGTFVLIPIAPPTYYWLIDLVKRDECLIDAKITFV